MISIRCNARVYIINFNSPGVYITKRVAAVSLFSCGGAFDVAIESFFGAILAYATAVEVTRGTLTAGLHVSAVGLCFVAEEEV